MHRGRGTARQTRSDCVAQGSVRASRARRRARRARMGDQTIDEARARGRATARRLPSRTSVGHSGKLAGDSGRKRAKHRDPLFADPLTPGQRDPRAQPESCGKITLGLQCHRFGRGAFLATPTRSRFARLETHRSVRDSLVESRRRETHLFALSLSSSTLSSSSSVSLSTFGPKFCASFQSRQTPSSSLAPLLALVVSCSFRRPSSRQLRLRRLISSCRAWAIKGAALDERERSRQREAAKSSGVSDDERSHSSLSWSRKVPIVTSSCDRDRQDYPTLSLGEVGRTLMITRKSFSTICDSSSSLRSGYKASPACSCTCSAI